MMPGLPMDNIWAARIAAPRMRARRKVRLETISVNRCDSSSLALGIAAPRVPEVDGQGQKNPAFVVDAAQTGMRYEVEALLAAIVGMGAPADIRQQAGGMPEPALLIRLLGAGRLKQRVGPHAQLARVVDRSGVQAARRSRQKEISGSLRRSSSDRRLNRAAPRECRRRRSTTSLGFMRLRSRSNTRAP